jgi:hypothetical protein
LDQQYIQKLRELHDRKKEQGDLEGVIAVANEIKRFQQEGAISEEELTGFLDIKRLQGSYTKQADTLERTKAKRILTLSAQYDRALGRLQRNFVKSNKIDAARTVQDERRRVASSEAVASAKTILSHDTEPSGTLDTQKQVTPTLASSAKWQDLTRMKYKSATGGKYFKQSLHDGDPKRIGDKLHDASEFIWAHASGKIEYDFPKPITEFKATIALSSNAGNVIFKVETDKGLVYTSEPITKGAQESISIQFAPSKKLVLITDANGPPNHDHSLWLNPKVR